jgi:hypothetical protein
MSFISYTVFEDIACTTIRSVANLYGRDAERALGGFRAFKARNGGSEPRVGDVIFACRIDCIGSSTVPSQDGASP